MKLIKILIGIATGFILLIISLGLINYYVYCWTSYLPFVGEDYKTIEFVYEKQNDPFHNHEVLESYDLVQIGTQLKSNPNYRVGDILDDHTLFVARNFKDVSYSIYIGKTERTAKHLTVGFDHFINQHQPEKSKSELGTAPDYYIYKNINQMIDEMPLSNAQKIELKSGVRINPEPLPQLVHPASW